MEGEALPLSENTESQGIGGNRWLESQLLGNDEVMPVLTKDSPVLATRHAKATGNLWEAVGLGPRCPAPAE